MSCETSRPSQAWAKAARDESGLWHSLVGHCTDVAVTGRELMATPVLRRRLSVAFEAELTEGHLDRLAIFIGLHDLGKALAGFQAKREQKLNIGQGHTAEGLAVLMARPESRQSIRFDLLQRWVDDAAAALYCTICHHGEPVADARIGEHLSSVSAQLERTIYGHDPLTEIARLTEALLETFSGALGEASMLIMTSAGQHCLAGIAMAADWMGSDADHFVYASGQDEGRAEEARRIALELIHDTGITGWALDAAAQAVQSVDLRRQGRGDRRLALVALPGDELRGAGGVGEYHRVETQLGDQRLALAERVDVAEHGLDVADPRPRHAQQMVAHALEVLAVDVQPGLRKHVVDVGDPAGDRVLDRDHRRVGPTVVDRGAETQRHIERLPRRFHSGAKRPANSSLCLCGSLNSSIPPRGRRRPARRRRHRCRLRIFRPTVENCFRYLNRRQQG